MRAVAEPGGAGNGIRGQVVCVSMARYSNYGRRMCAVQAGSRQQHKRVEGGAVRWCAGRQAWCRRGGGVAGSCIVKKWGKAELQVQNHR